MIRVLFVCTGNICRSPTAEGVFRHQLAAAGRTDEIACDSAGTTAFHVGEPPDPRTRAAAARRGYRLDDIRARRLEAADFSRFDVMLAMDRGHLREMRAMAPPGATARLGLFLDHARRHSGDVGDPYYGGPDGFETVLDMIEDGAQGLLADLLAAPPTS
ncbi:low molecular weight protein-tyrosine-phosphatase [Roseospirillum parvum]|uniref:protein-tyrosine-phosphatase n=1 Tax=Roseospirillum parvum TaxID=83401 RepID=A0A1G7ZJP3_9PROT|nr:low molecular weight protein-tyrosine-phosphatase [Roseospirillum parvum]SDH08933.1 protein-tyrosine phosphatase [Roseospirillum parvum]